MSTTDVLACSAWEDSSLTVMARVYGNAGTAIGQASLSSITCKVYDRATRTLVVSPTVTVSSAVFGTLQTADPRWTADATGYNFLFTVPAAAFPTGTRYRIEFIFTPDSGDRFPLVVEVSAIDLFGS